MRQRDQRLAKRSQRQGTCYGGDRGARGSAQLRLDPALDRSARCRRAARRSLQLGLGGHEGGGEQRLVAGVAVARSAASSRAAGRAPSAAVVDPARDAELGGQERLAVARVDVVDAQQEAAAAHLAHQLAVGQRGGERVAQPRAALAHPLHQARALRR